MDLLYYNLRNTFVKITFINLELVYTNKSEFTNTNIERRKINIHHQIININLKIYKIILFVSDYCCPLIKREIVYNFNMFT